MRIHLAPLWLSSVQKMSYGRKTYKKVEVALLFGLSRQDVMCLAFQLAEKSGVSHPFRDNSAGRRWFDGFRRRHPNLTLRSAQSLSFLRAKATNPQVIEDFFGKLGSIYARLNILTKPMQVYNVDECGVNVTLHKGRVVSELGRRNVHRVTASEKGKNHTIIVCGSASGQAIPPMIIFPRVRVPQEFEADSPPGSLLAAQKKGWVTSELYLRWFKFFLSQIPPLRPILLIQDGHSNSSHITVDLIQLAKENDIHIMCLPSHTTHVLQPLDVGVFSSFKHHAGKALNALVRSSPGRVPTTADIPKIISQAWPMSITAVNLMSGFRKTGIHPLNPGCIKDRELAPSKGIADSPPENFRDSVDSSSTANSIETHAPPSAGHSASGGTVTSSSPDSSLSHTMDSLFIRPKLKRSTRRRRAAYNHTAVMVTEDRFLKTLQEDKEARGRKPPQRRTSTSRRQRNQKWGHEKNKSSRVGKGKRAREKYPSSSESDCECPLCGQHYGEQSATWIQCSDCEEWYDTDCVSLNPDSLPEHFLCVKCA